MWAFMLKKIARKNSVPNSKGFLRKVRLKAWGGGGGGVFSLMNLKSVLNHFQMLTVFFKILVAKPTFATIIN